MIFGASQTAFTIVINTGVDLWFAFNGGKHFENHSSALHARKLADESDRIKAPKPIVPPEAIVPCIPDPNKVSELKVGTALQFYADPPLNTT